MNNWAAELPYGSIKDSVLIWVPVGTGCPMYSKDFLMILIRNRPITINSKNFPPLTESFLAKMIISILPII